jgi:hypothetical protein
VILETKQVIPKTKLHVEKPQIKGNHHTIDRLSNECIIIVIIIIRDKWDPVTTAWRVLRLRMEELPPDMENSCEYIEFAVADSRQGVVL